MRQFQTYKDLLIVNPNPKLETDQMTVHSRKNTGQLLVVQWVVFNNECSC